MFILKKNVSRRQQKNEKLPIIQRVITVGSLLPATEIERVNPYMHSVLFVGRRQTVQTQTRRRRERRLIRVSTVCLHSVLNLKIPSNNP